VSLDFARFRFEQEQLRKLFGEDMRLVRFAEVDAWPSFGVSFRCGRFLVQAHFAPDHPSSPPRVQVHPGLRSRHYYDDGRGLHLCYVHPNEWRPTYSMATVIGIVRVFLAKYELGSTECR
jgi:ubiquitin-protein ligase